MLQEATEETTVKASESFQRTGQAAMGGDDIVALLLSLVAVLVVIFVLAAIMKRLNLKIQNRGDTQILGTTYLGAKERIVIVQVGDDKLLLGVTAQSIQLLKTLPSDYNVPQQKDPNQADTGSWLGNIRQQFQQQTRRRND